MYFRNTANGEVGKCSFWYKCLPYVATDQYILLPVKGRRRPAAGKVTVDLASQLVMRHRLQLFIHLRAQDLRKGDKHPTPTLLVGYNTPYLLNLYIIRSWWKIYIFTAYSGAPLATLFFYGGRKFELRRNVRAKLPAITESVRTNLKESRRNCLNGGQRTRLKST